MKGPFNGHRLVRRGVAIAVVCALWLAACGVSVQQDGPGPIDPVGPVGPVGDEGGAPGSGNIVREERDGGRITRVLFGSEGVVFIESGLEVSLAVEADDNLLTHLETVVEEDILRIQTTEGVDIAPSRPPRYHIVLPELNEVELSGVGEIDVGFADSEILSVSLSGVGEISLRNVDVDLLLYSLSGVGSVSIEGRAEEQRGSVAGQCMYLAGDLTSDRAVIQASGSGSAVISVDGHLDVSAIDTASVEYYGSPAVSEEVDGLATVSALGEP